MGLFHEDITTANGGAHVSRPDSRNATAYKLVGATTFAWLIEDEAGVDLFQLDTNADAVWLGTTTGSYDLHLQGNQVFVELPDNQATAFGIREFAAPTSLYVTIDTTNADPVVKFGNTVNNPRVQVYSLNTLRLATLTTAQRGALAAVAGDLIYNSTTGNLEGYDSAWVDLGGGGGGHTIQAAYDGGAAATIASGVPIQLSHPATAGTNGYLIAHGWDGATTYTATPAGAQYNMAAAGGINSATVVSCIACLGQGNAGSGVTAAVDIDAGFDVGVRCFSPILVGAATYVQFSESASDPTAIANNGLLYSKDVSTVTQLFYRASDGTVTQITPGGGGVPHDITAGASQIIVEQNGTTGSFITADDTTSSERLNLMANDTSRFVNIGTPASVANINARLTFNSGDGTAAQLAYLEVDGANEMVQLYFQGSRYFSVSSATATTAKSVTVGSGSPAANSVSVGYGATNSASSVTIGESAVTSSFCVSVGRGATTLGGNSSACISYNSKATGVAAYTFGGATVANSGVNGIGLGYALNLTHADVFGCGREATSTATGQVIWGSDNYPYTTMYCGEGVIQAAPAAGFRIQATDASAGTGAAMTYAASAGTTAGGALSLATAATTTFVDRLKFPSNGPVEYNPNPAQTFPIKHSEGETTTLNAQTKTALTIASVTNQNGSFRAWFSGSAGDKSVGFWLFGAYRNNAGTLTVNITTMGPQTAEFSDDVGWGATAVVSGTNIAFDVTTDAGSGTVNWQAFVEYWAVAR